MPYAQEYDKPQSVDFLLVPNYSMLAFSAAIEPLRMANYVSQRKLYEWRLLSFDGEPVTSSAGLRTPVDTAARQLAFSGVLFVCGGLNIHKHLPSGILNSLREAAEQKSILGGICTGSYALAKADLLDGYRCTIHWESIAAVHEEHPELVISRELFELDRDRYTCSGGVAPMDMMLHIISKRHGKELAGRISEQLMCERMRDHHDLQRVPLKLRIGTGQPKLAEAVALMEANMEEPISLDELARHVGLSRRQLERLFKKYLNCVPTRYYLELRLERARLLLLQTSLPIVEIALASGFVSASHFSKCYREVYGRPPRDERRQVTG